MTRDLRSSTTDDQPKRAGWQLPANLTFGLIVFAVLVVCAILGLIWTPYEPNTQNFAATFKPPGLDHWLGTDHFGRDTLSRMLRGASTSVLVGVISVGIGTSIGLILGALSGYAGGLLDDFIMRVLDALSAFPTVLMALLISSVLRPSVTSAMLAVGIASIPTFARITRAGVISVKNLEYVDGARALGANETRILWRHILPNIAAPLIVQGTFAFGIAILAEAALSYLGLGTQPPSPSWGVMLRDAQSYIYNSPWPTIFPGLVIAITVLGLNLLGDGLRDRLDPRGR